MTLSRGEIERYSRQLLLPEFAQAMPRVREARVLVVGVGGLGTLAATYLAGAGVGSLTLADPDVVELSNLQRQVLYSVADVGRPKTQVAAARLQALNPGVRLETVGAVTLENAPELLLSHDLVLDASDNFDVRYVLSDVLSGAGRRWVWGAAGAYEGMLSVLGPGVSLRDVFPVPSGDDCDTVGVLGPVLGVVASMMASEALKVLSGVGEPLFGRLWTFDALSGRVRVIRMAGT